MFRNQVRGCTDLAFPLERAIRGKARAARIGVKRGMKLRMPVLTCLALLGSAIVRASTVPIGALSFDVFTPPANGFAGVNAFNISNHSQHGTKRRHSASHFPGELGPGPLLDPIGNPLLVLQFPSTTNVMPASFMATLTPTSEIRRYLRDFKEAS